MTGRYLTDLADVLAAAGLAVVELDGWQTRARSSGGYDGAPWCVMWHHTASNGDGAADAHYETFVAADAPICNLNVGRDGVVYVCAAGATNTNGKGGPLTLPDGRTVPADQMNTRAVGIELSNNGVGMTYPAEQMAAVFAASNAICAAYIGRADQVAQHWDWAPTRKIDPATATAVAGTWSPTSVTASGTWSLEDLRAECLRRADNTAPPIGDDDMTDEQAAQLTDVQAQLQEVRRLLGVLFGGVPPGNDGEAVALRSLYAEGETPADTRRMVGVMLGWTPPAPGTPEPDALRQLWT